MILNKYFNKRFIFEKDRRAVCNIRALICNHELKLADEFNPRFKSWAQLRKNGLIRTLTGKICDCKKGEKYIWGLNQI